MASKGKHIFPENSGTGKMAPNKAELWGATIFNFYVTRRFPDFTGEGGLGDFVWNCLDEDEDYAKDQLTFAENEEDPFMIRPYNITGLIQDDDVMGMINKSWIRVRARALVTRRRERKKE